jgi:hypothetical protein
MPFSFPTGSFTQSVVHLESVATQDRLVCFLVSLFRPVFRYNLRFV